MVSYRRSNTKNITITWKYNFLSSKRETIKQLSRWLVLPCDAGSSSKEHDAQSLSGGGSEQPSYHLTLKPSAWGWRSIAVTCGEGVYTFQQYYEVVAAILKWGELPSPKVTLRAWLQAGEHARASAGRRVLSICALVVVTMSMTLPLHLGWAPDTDVPPLPRRAPSPEYSHSASIHPR